MTVNFRRGGSVTGAQTTASSRPWYRNVFSAANVASATAAVVVFVLGMIAWDTNIGVLAAAIVAGSVSGFVWWLVARRTAAPSLDSLLDQIPLLGIIPADTSGPAPALGSHEARDSYTGLLREIEGRTTGQILLVSSPGPGQGASTVALNLAIATCRAGRRVMLVDANPSPNGISRFLSTGGSPGLAEVAAGTASLSEATRMWVLEDGTRFPMLPAGDSLADVDGLAGPIVADALDVVSERADLIILDVPPILWSTSTAELAAHADGTILVMSDSADPEMVATSIDLLNDAGAPVLGYVRNRSSGLHGLTPRRWSTAIVRAAAASFLLLAVFGIYTSAQLWYSWNRVETETLDTSGVVGAQSGEVAGAAGQYDVELTEDELAPAATPETAAPEQAYETLLIIGGDEVSGAADVILYLVRPTNGAEPFMVSLPRDLYVSNPCTGGNSRINALIHGCEDKDINGPSLLAYTVGEFTGIEVDHFVLFDFSGFATVIDAVGGVEICVEYAVADRLAQLSLPAGCTMASGAQALAWVRSRHTLQKIGDSWKSVPGAGDLLRNQHQQDVIMELFKELKSFGSPTELTAQIAGVADAFTLDDTLGIAEAVALAWGMRDIDLKDIKRLEIPVRLTRSKSGQSILVATESFDKVLANAYGGSLPNEDQRSEGSAALTGQALQWTEPLRGIE